MSGNPIRSVRDYPTKVDELIPLLRTHRGERYADALHLLLHETAWTASGELDAVCAGMRG